MLSYHWQILMFVSAIIHFLKENWTSESKHSKEEEVITFVYIYIMYAYKSKLPNITNEMLTQEVIYYSASFWSVDGSHLLNHVLMIRLLLNLIRTRNLTKCDFLRIIIFFYFFFFLPTSFDKIIIIIILIIIIIIMRLCSFFSHIACSDIHILYDQKFWRLLATFSKKHCQEKS